MSAPCVGELSRPLDAGTKRRGAPMQVTRVDLAWIAAIALAVIVLLVLHAILLPFAIGAMGAYALLPLVDRLETLGINRAAAALILVLVLVLVLIAATILIIPILLGETRFFLDQFPTYVERLQAILLSSSEPWLRRLLGNDVHIEQSTMALVAKFGDSWLDESLTSLWTGGMAILSLFSIVVLAPIITIYMIIDWRPMITTIDGWLPAERRPAVHALIEEVHDTVSAFLRGQTIICLILACFYAAALGALGLRHAVVLGVAAGLISFIPYLGAATGLILSTCVGLVQFWPDWVPVAAILAIFLFGESAADYVLSPRIIGRRVKLNPLWLIFALSAFGWLFGFVGLLIAVPLAATIGVVIRFALAHGRAQAVEPIPPPG